MHCEASLALRVAMEMAGVIAAVAPVAALLLKACNRSLLGLPVPITMNHGAGDGIAPLGAGAMAGRPAGGGVFSVRETAGA